MKTQKFLSKAIALTAATAAAVAPLSGLMTTVHAAGVAVTLSDTTIDAATATEITMSFTAAAIDDNGTVTVTVAGDPNAVAPTIEACAAPSGTLTGDFGAYAATSTFTLTDPFAGGAADVCVKVTSAQQSLSFAVVTSSGDYGAALAYVAEDNVVEVTANVAPTLSFNIRDWTDGHDKNTCALGTVSTASNPAAATYVDDTDDGDGICGYGLAVGTNAQGGAQVQVIADGALNNANGSITNIADGGTFTPGTETYGYESVIPATTGRNVATGAYTSSLISGTYTDLSDSSPVVADAAGYTWATTTSPVPTTSQSFVAYNDGIHYSGTANGANDLTLITHGMTVSSATPAGFYDQLVTYTVTATF